MIDSDKHLRYLPLNLVLRFATMSSFPSCSQMMKGTTSSASASGSALAANSSISVSGLVLVEKMKMQKLK